MSIIKCVYEKIFFNYVVLKQFNKARPGKGLVGVQL